MSSNSKTAKTSKVSTKKSVAPKKSGSTKKSTEPVDQGEKKERKRRDVTKDSVDGDFTGLQAMIEAEISRLRESTEKVRGIKILRSINKRLKVLHSDTKRVMKLKKKNNRKKSVVSGFLKPVKISKELADFTGWDINQTYSRVNVTKHICDYIKSNELYDTNDKRLILCDDRLKKLLNYDPSNPPKGKDGKLEYLNYFRLQRYLKQHFIKIEVLAETETVERPKSAKAPTPAPAVKASKSVSKSKKVVMEEEEDEESNA